MSSAPPEDGSLFSVLHFCGQLEDLVGAADEDDVVALAEAVIRADVRVDLVVMLDGDDVDLIFAADIQTGQRLTDPCGLNGQLINGIKNGLILGMQE